MPRLTTRIEEKVSISYDIFNENPELPLVIFLHGFGEVEERVFKGQKSKIPFMAIVPREHRPHFSYLVPYIDQYEKWDPLKIKALVEYMIHERGFNENKIIISGHSWGARGVWDVSTKYPHLFAAIIALAGVGTPLLGGLLRDTATLIIHGKDDDVVPCSHSSDMHWHIRGDMENELLHQLFIIDGLKHNITRACFTDDYIWKWIKKVLEKNNDNSLCVQGTNSTQ